MWNYSRNLQYPINIKNRNPEMAKVIISQYGGPDGELAASLRYLSQRFGMPDQNSKAILNDIGTEEYAPTKLLIIRLHQKQKNKVFNIYLIFLLKFYFTSISLIFINLEVEALSSSDNFNPIYLIVSL